MRHSQGIVIVSVLVILVVIMAVGVGSTFMTQLNLRVAENTRSNTIAKYNAAAALDTALVVLSNHWNETLELPATQNDFSTLLMSAAPPNGDYHLLDYQYYAATAPDPERVMIRIEGRTLSNARYVAEMLVAAAKVATPSEAQADPLFGEGFVANGNINFNGNSTISLNMWAGGTINLTGGQSRVTPGYYARAAGNQCRIGNGPACDTRVPPPNAPSPVFSALRAEIMISASVTGASGSYQGCNRIITSNTTLSNVTNEVICVNSSRTLTLNGTIHGVTVIGDTTTTVNVNATVSPPAPTSANPKPFGVKVASGTVGLSQNSNFSGINTVAAVGNITFGKGVLSSDGTARTLIATQGNVTINGNGNNNIYAVFWTGGNVTVNGTANTFRGSIVAHGNITSNGGVSQATLAQGIDNEYIPVVATEPTYENAGLQLLSRR